MLIVWKRTRKVRAFAIWWSFFLFIWSLASLLCTPPYNRTFFSPIFNGVCQKFFVRSLKSYFYFLCFAFVNLTRKVFVVQIGLGFSRKSLRFAPVLTTAFQFNQNFKTEGSRRQVHILLKFRFGKGVCRIVSQKVCCFQEKAIVRNSYLVHLFSNPREKLWIRIAIIQTAFCPNKKCRKVKESKLSWTWFSFITHQAIRWKLILSATILIQANTKRQRNP